MLKFETRAKKSAALWTAARVVAFFWFGALGWAMARVYLFHEDNLVPFIPIFWIGAIFLGAMLGWRFMAKKPGFGYKKSLGRGFASAVWLYLLIVLWQASLFTYVNLNAGSFDSPEIIPGIWMSSFVFFVRNMLDWNMVLVGVVGGLMGGQIVGTVNWFWR
ncbi:MAG: TrgA family protein [Pseudomonadota bacterium]